ncbi:MAG: short-chain dehydrogenase/reductase SDR [candidate division NC10 bacterium CSP1-5]|nr:MAG: short-chain dehydrogenase/reductase SDR [candidate division NC10 bacterium CSP1-5]
MRLQGKVALVTGGSQGVGRAVAAAYAREGATVIVTARHLERLEGAAAEIRKGGGNVVPLRADVADRQQVQQLAGEIKRRFDGLHVLVNNASLLGPRVPIVEYPEEDWQGVIAVNLHGPFFVIKACLPLMIPTGGGSIINVSSGVGRIGKPRWGAYAASKFALEGLTQVLAAELLPFHIRVNAVNPGGTRTGMRAAAYPEEDPLTLPTPEQITPVFVYLASDESRDVTGKSFEARDFMSR